MMLVGMVRVVIGGGIRQMMELSEVVDMLGEALADMVKRVVIWV
jgi:hypothetical protein